MKTVSVGLHEIEYDDGELTEGQAKRQFYMANRKAQANGRRIYLRHPFHAVNMGAEDDWRIKLEGMKKGAGV